MEWQVVDYDFVQGFLLAELLEQGLVTFIVEYFVYLFTFHAGRNFDYIGYLIDLQLLEHG